MEKQHRPSPSRRRGCKVCRHAQRQEIAYALALGASLRQLAERYPPLSIWSLHRHRKHMTPDELASVITGVEASLNPIELATLAQREGANMLSVLIGMRRQMEGLEERAIEDDMFSVALAAHSAQRADLELIGRLIGPFMSSREITQEVRRIEIIPVAPSPVVYEARPPPDPAKGNEPAPADPVPLEAEPLERANVVRLDQRPPLFGFSGNKERT